MAEDKFYSKFQKKSSDKTEKTEKTEKNSSITTPVTTQKRRGTAIWPSLFP